VDIFQATVEKEPIRAMEISRRRRMLYVTSDTGIRQIDLAMCSARYRYPTYYITLLCRYCNVHNADPDPALIAVHIRNCISGLFTTM
jgi:hypothetical protein